MCAEGSACKRCLPCGHLICCEDCTDAILTQGIKCPLCQGQIEDTLDMEETLLKPHQELRTNYVNSESYA